MRVALALSLVLALGCNTRQRIGGGAVGVTVVGLALTYSNEARADEEVGTQGKVGITMILAGLVTLFVVAALDETANKEPPKEIKAPAAPPTNEVERAEARARETAQQKRAQAWELTKQAQEAARSNDCAKVTELSAQVGALDAEFYSEVFMKDEPVQRCFAPTEPPVEPAPAVPPPAVPPPVVPATP